MTSLRVALTLAGNDVFLCSGKTRRVDWVEHNIEALEVEHRGGEALYLMSNVAVAVLPHVAVAA